MQSKLSIGFNAEKIKEAAQGRVINILESVAGIPVGSLDGKHHPCPKCGGTDRFRLIDEKSGCVLCNQCFQKNNGDFISAVIHFRNVDFPEALRLIADYLGMKPQPRLGKPQQASPQKQSPILWTPDTTPNQDAIADWCKNHKPGTGLGGVLRCQGTTGLYAQIPSLGLPMFGCDLKTVTGWAVYHLDGSEIDGKKVINSFGSKSGMIGTMEVLRQLSKDSTVYKVEGPTDAIAIADAIPETEKGTVAVFANACGANENPDKSPYKEFLEAIAAIGCKLDIIGDNDEAGQNGVKKWGEYAAQKRCNTWTVALPKTMFDASVNDVRDYFLVGGLFTDLDNLAKPFVADQTEQTEPDTSKFVSCGVETLDKLLSQIEPVDWESYQPVGRNGKPNPPTEKDYLLRSIEQILLTADKATIPFVNRDRVIYYHTGTHYKRLSELELQNFLIEATVRCGVPVDTARYHTFVDKNNKQFLIDTGRHNSGVSEPDTAYINLQNGTLFFDKSGYRFEKHSHLRFIRYCLPFPYDPDAIAPLWQTHIERSLPNPEKQLYLAKCLALPFCPRKIEIAPIFYGLPETGKSTTLDVYEAMVGVENISNESLSDLTQKGQPGAFSRSRLDGKLINIASDVSAKIGDEGMMKTLISGEAVSAQNKGKDGFSMRNYAKLMFALNELPSLIFSEVAIKRRCAVIEFDQQVTAKDKDTNFARNIVENELPGVLNWVIKNGLVQLLVTGRLYPPSCVAENMERLRKEVDPISAWLEKKGYYLGNSHSIAFDEAFADFDSYRIKNKHRELSKPKFSRRLRSFGYEVVCVNGKIGTVIYYSKTPPETLSTDQSTIVPSESPENTGCGTCGMSGTNFQEQQIICNDYIHRTRNAKSGV